MKTLLVILAHPDDESFGPGGTLAKYARSGAAVHYLCGTRGESGTVEADKLHGFKDTAELRTAELACAAKELGLTSVRFLGFRDSGMVGTSDNEHPDSLHAASLDEVARCIGEHILELRPDAILTHDQFGGYGHPDHIKLHCGTLRAYEMLFGITIDLSEWATGAARRVRASGPASRPGDGLAPPKLYFTTLPKNLVRLGVRLMPLFRQNPRKFGRNRDIDLVQIASWDVPITAKVDTKAFVMAKERASACHASQQAPPQQNPIIRLLFRRSAGTEFFSRVFPPFAPGQPVERDLL